MSAYGPYCIVVTDALGREAGRLYVGLDETQRQRVDAGEVWAVVRELLDGDIEEVAP